jgi:hypothetical protein
MLKELYWKASNPASGPSVNAKTSPADDKSITDSNTISSVVLNRFMFSQKKNRALGSKLDFAAKPSFK